jgi:hypothetical protein
MARRLVKTHANERVAVAAPDAQPAPNAGPEAEELAMLAYQYWLERGSPTGTPGEDWLRAVEEVTLRQERLKRARTNR